MSSISIQKLIECPRLLPPQRIRQQRTNDGQVSTKKVNLTTFFFEYLEVYLRRIKFVLQTGHWANINYINHLMIKELRQQASFINGGNVPSPQLKRRYEVVHFIVKKIIESRLAKDNHFEIQELLTQCNHRIGMDSKATPGPSPKMAKKKTAIPNQSKKSFFPLKEEKLEELSVLTRKEYSYNIKKKLAQRKSVNKGFFEQANKLFNESWNRALIKTQELHKEFQTHYDPDKTIKIIKTPHTLVVRSTLTQLDQAVQIVKENFPHLTLLAYNIQQRAQIARLVQIILAGYSVIKEPLPNTDLCFALEELETKTSPLKTIALSPYNNFLDYQLGTVNTKSQLITGHELKANLQNLIGQFVKECFIKTENELQICGTTYKINPIISSESSDISIFETIKNHYSQYLLANPHEIKKIITDDANCTFFDQVIKTLKPDSKKLAYSAFPQQAFETLFAPTLSHYSQETSPSSKIIYSKVRAFIDTANFEPKILQQLTSSSSCDIREIEPLIRKKFLELMIVMNQSLHKSSIHQVHGSLAPTIKEKDPSLFLLPISIKFIYTPDFNSLTSIFRFKISANYPQGTYTDSYFTDFIGVAEICSQIRIPSFKTPAKPQCQTFNKLKLGWLAKRETWEKLATQFYPEFIENQPNHQEPLLLDKLNNMISNLKIFSVIEVDQDLAIKDQKIQIVPLKKSSWLNNIYSDPDPKFLEDFEKYLSEFFITLKDYKKVCKKLNKKTEETNQKLIETLKEVIEGLSILEETYEGFDLEVSPLITLQEVVRKKLLKITKRHA